MQRPRSYLSYGLTPLNMHLFLVWSEPLLWSGINKCGALCDMLSNEVILHGALHLLMWIYAVSFSHKRWNLLEELVRKVRHPCPGLGVSFQLTGTITLQKRDQNVGAVFGLSKDQNVYTYTWRSRKSSCSWNLPDFTWNPLANLINQIIKEKLFSFMQCSGKAMSQDFMKSSGFHEICRISKDQQLPGMVRPMIFMLLFGGRVTINIFESAWKGNRLCWGCGGVFDNQHGEDRQSTFQSAWISNRLSPILWAVRLPY